MKIDGQELQITPTDFETALALQKAIADALKEKGIRLNLGKLEIDKDNPLATEVNDNTIDGILEMVMSIATYPEVINLLFECCKRVLLGKGERSKKIDRDFFEDSENRQYFYPIMVEVLKANIGPFFKNLGSLFGAFQGIIGNDPT